MRNRFFIVLLLAITTGGGLAYATYNFMNAQPSQTVVNAPTQPVVVAAGDLSLGSEVKADDVKVIQFPKGQAPEGAFARAARVANRAIGAEGAAQDAKGSAGDTADPTTQHVPVHVVLTFVSTSDSRGLYFR